MSALRLLMQVFVLLLSVPALFNPAAAQSLGDLEFITETYPPYNFSADGLLKGIAVDLLVAASHKVDDPITRDKIKLQPWARGYRSALSGPKIALFSTTRTGEREDKFKWVGPIAKTRIVVLAKKSSSIVIGAPGDLQKYSVGAIRDDVGEQLIRALDVPEGKIQQASNADSLAKKLEAGRIQLWAYEENVARWFLKKNGFDNEDYEAVYTLKEGDLYYSFSKDVDESAVKALQSGIDRVKAEPGKIGKTLYDDILSDYL